MEAFLFWPEPVHYALGKLVVPGSWDVDTKLGLDQHGTLQPRIPELKQSSCPSLTWLRVCPTMPSEIFTKEHNCVSHGDFPCLLSYLPMSPGGSILGLSSRLPSNVPNALLSMFMKTRCLRPKSNTMTKLFLLSSLPSDQSHGPCWHPLLLHAGKSTNVTVGLTRWLSRERHLLPSLTTLIRRPGPTWWKGRTDSLKFVLWLPHTCFGRHIEHIHNK